MTATEGKIINNRAEPDVEANWAGAQRTGESKFFSCHPRKSLRKKELTASDSLIFG
jgi:hypothetical protein